MLLSPEATGSRDQVVILSQPLVSSLLMSGGSHIGQVFRFGRSAPPLTGCTQAVMRIVADGTDFVLRWKMGDRDSLDSLKGQHDC
jgi:hypothetical protein